MESAWTHDQPVIIASNSLPVQLLKDENGTWYGEWAGDRVIETHNTFSHHQISPDAKVKFVGRPNVEVPIEDRPLVEEILKKFHCIAVFVEKEEAEAYYEGYCKLTLWPTLHNIIDVYNPTQVILDENVKGKPTYYWTPEMQQKCWNAYTNVNRLIAQAVCEVYEPGDIIWIHDYHLLIAPSYIARKIRIANIGLFLHVPFPSSEVFRTLSSRKELLRGMLNADHIGFHLFEYARHFLSCCKRVLGITYRPSIRGQLGIDYGGRRVGVSCSHMAIDTSRVDKCLKDDKMRDQIVSLQQQYRGKTIFSGCDSIERLKGIPLKFLAFDQFLTRCPEYIERVVFVQIGIKHTSRACDYERSKEEIENVVNQINMKYYERAKRNVIEYQEVDEYCFSDRIALWRVSDVQVITVLRDGLNTLPFEYIAAHSTVPGVVILSEFSGCSRVLNGVLMVNPWELDQVIEAMQQAVSMPLSEKEHRKSCDLSYVTSNPPKRWAKCVLDDIVCAKKKDSDCVYVGAGFGLDFRVMEVRATFRKLEEPEICKAYRETSHRAIFLDYYRTLVPSSRGIRACMDWPTVPTSVLTTLEYLCKDPRNRIYIVSGCTRAVLLGKFGSVPGLGLIAEHGYFMKHGVLGHDASLSRPWEVFGALKGSHADTWRDRVNSVMQLYVDRTNGAWLEKKESSMLFRYSKSDFEFGALQAAELKDHLAETLKGWPLSVLHGKDYIEVRPEGLGKGAVISQIWKSYESKDSCFDFALCMGDDNADELMFEVLNEKVKSGKIRSENAFTCTIGQKPSKAEYFVDDHEEVGTILNALRKVSTKSNRNYSVSDMQVLAKSHFSVISTSMHNTPNVPKSMPIRSNHHKPSLSPVLEEEISIDNIEDELQVTDSIISKLSKIIRIACLLVLWRKRHQLKKSHLVAIGMAYIIYKWNFSKSQIKEQTEFQKK